MILIQLFKAGLIDPSNSIVVDHTCDPSHDNTTDRVLQAIAHEMV